MMKSKGTEESEYHSASLQNMNRDVSWIFMGVWVMVISLLLEPVVTCCWSMNVYVWHMAWLGTAGSGIGRREYASLSHMGLV